MYTLQKLNVVKIVDTELKKDELISKGFTLVQAQEKASSNEKPLNKMNLEELKEYTALKEIDITGLTKKDEIMAKIKEIEQGK